MTPSPCQTCRQPAVLHYIEGAPRWWPNSVYRAWYVLPEHVEICVRLRVRGAGCCNSGACGTREEAIERWEAAKG